VADLSRKVQEGLEEGRILVLGVQMLLGFEFRAFFHDAFESLPRWTQLTKLGALVLELAAFAMIALPAAYHRLAESGEDTGRMQRFTRQALGVALLPIAVALGLDVLVAAVPVLGGGGAAAAGGVVGALALGVWYGWTADARRRHGGAEDEPEDAMAPSKLDNKIRHLLTEARMMLPGALALLGFSLGASLTSGFRELPRAAQLVHLASVGLTMLAIVLFVAIAAYHRIVERGEDTERFLHVANRLLVGSMTPIALALSAQLGVVTYAVVRSAELALGAAIVSAVLFHAAWLGFPLIARARRRRTEARRPAWRRATARA
jgi:hypothetical protein